MTWLLRIRRIGRANTAARFESQHDYQINRATHDTAPSPTAASLSTPGESPAAPYRAIYARSSTRTNTRALHHAKHNLVHTRRPRERLQLRSIADRGAVRFKDDIGTSFCPNGSAIFFLH